MARGLGMTIAAFDPYLESSAFTGADRYATLEDLARVADVLSLHIPLTDANVGLIAAEILALMKPGSILINTARGGLIDLAAVERALEDDHLFGVGLDVTDPEPLPPDHPMLARDDVVVTPHVAAGTSGAKRRIFTTAFDQVIDVLNGKRPPHLVNPEVWA